MCQNRSLESRSSKTTSFGVPEFQNNILWSSGVPKQHHPEFQNKPVHICYLDHKVNFLFCQNRIRGLFYWLNPSFIRCWTYLDHKVNFLFCQNRIRNLKFITKFSTPKMILNTQWHVLVLTLNLVTEISMIPCLIIVSCWLRLLTNNFVIFDFQNHW